MQRRRDADRDGQPGQSLVELALMLPLLMAIMLGILDLGRVYYTQIAITNAARVGAEYAIYSSRPVDMSSVGVKKMITDEVGAFVALDPNLITIKRTTASWDSSKTVVTVEIRHKFTPIAPFTSRFWGGGDLTLRATSTSRQVR